MLLAVLAVALGYLYLIRFCGTCGRMVRNLKLTTCPRCSAPLPRHGMAGGVREERAPRPSSRSPDDGPRA
jgi:predicted amidophosphoribosyltransferase